MLCTQQHNTIFSCAAFLSLCEVLSSAEISTEQAPVGHNMTIQYSIVITEVSNLCDYEDTMIPYFHYTKRVLSSFAKKNTM